MSLLKIFIYNTKTGKQPYLQWQNDLDTTARAVVRNRIERVRLGNFGDCKMLKDGQGVWEFRIDYGPGYRIYFGKQGAQIVILLVGGDKKTQLRDIAKAKLYWKECKELKYE